MNTTRRKFLAATAATAAGTKLPKMPHSLAGVTEDETLDAYQIAKRHLIARDLPTPNFFEGMLLGNGDIGVCVTVRPDALGLHLGKVDSWDIRVSEDHYQHVLPFNELLKLWECAGEEAKRLGKPEMLYLESSIDFFREYTTKVTASYDKPWPRPWPCGIIWIHWDSREVRVLRQGLDPSSGLFTLDLECDNLRGQQREVTMRCFVNWTTGHVSVSTEEPAPFASVAYYPNWDPEAQLPVPEIGGSENGDFAEFTGYQLFPATPPTKDNPEPPRTGKDRNFALVGRLQGKWALEGIAQNHKKLEKTKDGNGTSFPVKIDARRVFLRNQNKHSFRLDLTLFTTRDHPDNVVFAKQEVSRLAQIPIGQLRKQTEKHWKEFWSRSAVEFEDKELERIWYHNQYFLACCLRQSKVAPGLFGNWASGKIGTAWHGDYHLDYNAEQVFWGVFSSNHVDQHLPYVELCENVVPMAESFAREKFGLPGAFFPVSAYPVPSQVMPYPVPPGGYQICNTSWAVQSLWWHYRYTLDKDFLKRVYPLLRAAAQFVVAFAKKESDGKYHFIPTVSPENWGFTVDFRLNKDCIMDLALAEFLLDAVVEASQIFDIDATERSNWADVRANLAPYPKTEGPYGEVWLDILNAPPEHVYNVPVTLAPVFPGEQVGIGRGDECLAIARRTARTIRLEGGNDLVFQPLIRARLGLLNLDWFKREVRYCTLPNGVANDRVRQIDGRYSDSIDFDYMMRMGVWTENFSLPAVLNECLMQSYTDVIRLFPNTQKLGPVRFQDLRAVGAFLVSASYDGTTISRVSLTSEKGAMAHLANPWPKTNIRVTRVQGSQPVQVITRGEIVEFPTEPGERYKIEPRSIAKLG